MRPSVPSVLAVTLPFLAFLISGCASAPTTRPAAAPTLASSGTAPSSPAISVPPTPSPTPSVAVASPLAIATGGDPTSIDWAQATTALLAPDGSGATVGEIVAGGPGWVAVGGTGGPGAPGRAAIWTSADGLRWKAVPDLPDADGLVINAVATDGHRLVAAGGTPCCADMPVAAVWTSDDGGASWRHAPDTPSLLACRPGCDVSGDGIHALAYSPAGWVAVGLAGGPAAWTSRDGITWTRSPETFGQKNSNPAGVVEAGVRDIVAGGPGFVAVGCDPCPPFGETAAAWTSTDGRHWSRAQVSGAGTFRGGDAGRPDGAELRAVAALPDGRLVAVGAAFTSYDASYGMAWVSNDGRRWTRPGPGMLVGACDEAECAGFVDVAAGRGIVAVGHVDVVEQGNFLCRRTSIWWSSDGRSWRSVGEPVGVATSDKAATLDRVAAGPSGFVAAGLAPLDSRGMAGLTWSSPPRPGASIVATPSPTSSLDPCH